jgi:hypothetical protein
VIFDVTIIQKQQEKKPPLLNLLFAIFDGGFPFLVDLFCGFKNSVLASG